MQIGSYLHIPVIGQKAIRLAMRQHHEYLALKLAQADNQPLEQPLSSKNQRAFILPEAGAVAASENDRAHFWRYCERLALTRYNHSIN